MSKRNIGLLIALIIIGGVIYYLQAQKPARVSTQDGQSKELVDVQGFINSEPFKISDYIGKKVILVDFWTYSCINCQRTTPYLNAWWDEYKDQGLLIIGVHTPEFEFEKNYDNVVQATKNMGIKYPVVQDNNYSTWTAFGNRYWPRKYLIDLNGDIVYDHIGEGAYDETEAKIRELLGITDMPMASPTDIKSVDSDKVGSAETYFGSKRGQQNSIYLQGDWEIAPEYAQNQTSSNKVVFPYKAKAVYMVAAADQTVSVDVYVDGQFLKSIQIKDSKLYTLVNSSSYGSHKLELRIKNPGLKLYTFTFG